MRVTIMMISMRLSPRGIELIQRKSEAEQQLFRPENIIAKPTMAVILIRRWLETGKIS